MPSLKIHPILNTQFSRMKKMLANCDWEKWGKFKQITHTVFEKQELWYMGKKKKKKELHLHSIFVTLRIESCWKSYTAK